MSDKKRRTVTLDPENHSYLKQQYNASALVNDLVTQLREGGDSDTAALELQIQHKREELCEAKNRVERLEKSLNELMQIRDATKARETARLHEAREALSEAPKEPTNPAVERWASKLDMTPAELLDAL